MQTKQYLRIAVKLRKVSAGLPRRKVCIRSVHHIFRLMASEQETEGEGGCEADPQLRSPAFHLPPETLLA
ncbi:MAG TPA: hypothetical protein VIP46_08810 [Pyrinomonadaceae bacterium]